LAYMVFLGTQSRGDGEKSAFGWRWGAQPGDVPAMVLRETAVLVAAGLLLDLPTTIWQGAGS
jgi:hypothetical protein